MKRNPPKSHKAPLGQNFLADLSAVERIIAALGDIRDRLVIEVGPGRGALTDRLATRAGHLLAIELDPSLSAGLPPNSPAIRKSPSLPRTSSAPI